MKKATIERRMKKLNFVPFYECDSKFSLNLPLMIIHHLVYPTKLSPASNLLRSPLNKYIASIYAEIQNNLKLKSGGFSPSTLSGAGGCSPCREGCRWKQRKILKYIFRIHPPFMEKFFSIAETKLIGYWKNAKVENTVVDMSFI